MTSAESAQKSRMVKKPSTAEVNPDLMIGWTCLACSDCYHLNRWYGLNNTLLDKCADSAEVIFTPYLPGWIWSRKRAKRVPRYSLVCCPVCVLRRLSELLPAELMLVSLGPRIHLCAALPYRRFAKPKVL